MRPLTKEELTQEAERAWNNYLGSEPMLTPAKTFFDGYMACYARCLGRMHQDFLENLDRLGKTIQSLHTEAIEEIASIKQVTPKFNIGDEIQDDCNSFVILDVEYDRQRYNTTYKCMAASGKVVSAPHFIRFKEQDNFTLVRHAPKYHVGQYVKWGGGIFPVNKVNEFEGGYSYYIGTFGFIEESQLSPVTESDIKGLAVE